jgi:hypothetical protein
MAGAAIRRRGKTSAVSALMAWNKNRRRPKGFRERQTWRPAQLVETLGRKGILQTMKGHAAVGRHMHHFAVDHRARNFQTGKGGTKWLEAVAPKFAARVKRLACRSAITARSR